MRTYNILPDDLEEDILSRLPVRHLLRLRCVSKSWCALIDSTKFIRKHHQIQSAFSKEEGHEPLFVISQSTYPPGDPTQFYLLSKKQGDVVLCLTPALSRDRIAIIDDPDLFSSLCCIGIVNGIVGLCWGYDYLGLWNPATREFKAIPSPRPIDPDSGKGFTADVLGLGFDPKSNDFKIVRAMCWDIVCWDINEGKGLYEIYSLKTNSWKSLKPPSLTNLWVNFSRTDGYHNGVYYWTAAENDVNYKVRRLLILSFDFSKEVFKFFDPPLAAITRVKNFLVNFDWMVGQYMEFLALIFSHQRYREEVCSLEIWVASSFDVGDDGEISAFSWQHLFTIGPIDGVYAYSAFVAFRTDGDVLLNIHHDGEREECNLYNPSTRTFKNLGLSFHCGYSYVESLFPLSKRQIRSYQE